MPHNNTDYITFATKYANRQIRTYDKWLGKEITGRIVGYADVYGASFVIIERDDGGGWSATEDRSRGIWTAPLYPNKGYRHYTINELELIEELKPVKPYPHICKVCSSPARKCESITLCSNLHCRSRKKVSKKYKTEPIIHGSSPDYPLKVKCPICKCNVNQVNAYLPTHNYPAAYCKEHKWQRYEFNVGYWYDVYSDGISQFLGHKNGYWKTIKKYNANI
jgi:hypothetical protein